MKKVFSNLKECIHIFASQSQSEGRSSNVFFYDKKIYSYGHHYLLAEFRTNSKGEEFVYINDSGYSVTTQKHIGLVNYATNQFRQFRERNIRPNLVLFQLQELKTKLFKARKPEIYIVEAQRLLAKHKEYLDFMGLKLDKGIKEISKVFSQEVDLVSFVEKEKEKFKKEEALKAKKRKKELQDTISDWYSGGRNWLPNNFDKILLRFNSDKTMIETSKNAKVSVRAAKTLYGLILAKKDIKGFEIDNYKVISINGVLTIGCHKIELDEMHKIGKELLKIND